MKKGTTHRRDALTWTYPGDQAGDHPHRPHGDHQRGPPMNMASDLRGPSPGTTGDHPPRWRGPKGGVVRSTPLGPPRLPTHPRSTMPDPTPLRPMSTNPLDAVARALFTKALADDCAGDLLSHLFSGDAVTIGQDGEFVYITEQQMEGGLYTQ